MGLFSCFDANKEDKADAVEQRRRDTDLRKRRDAPGDNMALIERFQELIDKNEDILDELDQKIEAKRERISELREKGRDTRFLERIIQQHESQKKLLNKQQKLLYSKQEEQFTIANVQGQNVIEECNPQYLRARELNAAVADSHM